MEWTTLQPKEWQQAAPHVDTLILPLYRMESLDIGKIKHLEKVIHTLENRLTGRVLLLPMIPYIEDHSSVFSSYIHQVTRYFLQAGFSYLVLVGDSSMDWSRTQSEVKPLFTALTLENEPTHEQIEQQVESIYQKILDQWTICEVS